MAQWDFAETELRVCNLKSWAAEYPAVRIKIPFTEVLFAFSYFQRLGFGQFPVQVIDVWWNEHPFIVSQVVCCLFSTPSVIEESSSHTTPGEE